MEITIKDVICLLADKMPDCNPEIDHLPARLADVPRLWVNNAKLSSLMDISSEISFEQGVEKTIAFYREMWKENRINQEVPVQNW